MFRLWDSERTMFAGQDPMNYQPKRFQTDFTGKVIGDISYDPERNDLKITPLPDQEEEIAVVKTPAE